MLQSLPCFFSYHPAEWKNGNFVALRRLGCHPTERSWMEVGRGASSSSPRSKRRLFIASIRFSRVYDHSLPHSRLATSDVEGE
ncbi:unnamed protein product [Spirodela intermedia]|uniref:Uncharacterized protein n=1 Tax=Spirodela intermedia TaxID=51605 RepID=A0A7I8K6E2_SPIIN|nr:unnamed protein product [Spirodela intermedia]